MQPNAFSRRAFSMRLAAFFSGLGLVETAFAASSTPEPGLPPENEVSHTAEAIRQEIVFKAGRQRVYATLTDAKQFAKVVQFSAAGMSLGNVPTEISRDVGGSFSLFGGHIVGRHVELATNERIVQAWRVVDWSPGIYSIAKFELVEQGAG